MEERSGYFELVIDKYRIISEEDPEIKKSSIYNQVVGVLMMQSFQEDFDWNVEKWVDSETFEGYVGFLRIFFDESYNAGIKEFETIQGIFADLDDMLRTSGIEAARGWYFSNCPYPGRSHSSHFPGFEKKDILAVFDKALMLKEPKYIKEYKMRNMFY